MTVISIILAFQDPDLRNLTIKPSVPWVDNNRALVTMRNNMVMVTLSMGKLLKPIRFFKLGSAEIAALKEATFSVLQSASIDILLLDSW